MDIVQRRRFLATTTLALAGACTRAPEGERPRTILILGGTNFVGPQLIRAAQESGHTVTIFNRGVTAPEPPAGVELLRGDRNAAGGLAVLQGTRRWDAVIDTWAGHPRAVDATTSLLAGRTDMYLYTSSIAVYGDYRASGITEDAAPAVAAVAELGEEPSYPVAKRSAEQVIEQRFAGRCALLRCTSIAGEDARGAGRDEGSYWPLRIRRGGDILAPDDPAGVIQLIDVRDVARFAMRVIAEGAAGAFNLVGPAEPLLFRDWLEAMRSVWQARPESADSDPPTFEWIDPDWLIANGVTPFSVLPNWIPADDPEPGFYRISNARALAAGLTYRPLRSTLDDGFAGLQGRPFTMDGAGGLSAEREATLLDAWRRHATRS